MFEISCQFRDPNVLLNNPTNSEALCKTSWYTAVVTVMGYQPFLQPPNWTTTHVCCSLQVVIHYDRSSDYNSGYVFRFLYGEITYVHMAAMLASKLYNK